MDLIKVLADAAITFVIVLVVAAVVTFFYSLIAHGSGAVDWETAFRFAIILAIVLPWLKARDRKEKKSQGD